MAPVPEGAIERHAVVGLFDESSGRRTPACAKREAARPPIRPPHDEATRVLLERYSPPGVVVDANNQIVLFRGKTGAFLEAPAGDPSLNLLKMVREGLLHPLKTALQAARRKRQSANEEILSSNEELQSTNEELDTAKEELQSTNEELNTVNEELHSPNEELTRVNRDLVNLLANVDITIVIIGEDMRIRRFTPMAE